MFKVCLGMSLGMLISVGSLMVRDAIGDVPPAPKPEPQDLVVKSIKVVDAEGRTCVTIVPEGVWVQDPCDVGKNVSLHRTKGYGPCLSIMDGASSPSRFAVSTTNKEAYIQVVGKDGKVYMIDAKDLVKR